MYHYYKRVFDIFLSSALILIFLPSFIIIFVLLCLFNDKDVLFFQERIGFESKPFKIIKFSSMLKNSPNMKGGTITTRNDPRVTKIGRILRMTKLNELPQLFNVLKGDMSFIGPRPMLNNGIHLYSIPVQNILHQSMPGITGIASVVFRDEEKLVSESQMSPEEFYKIKIFPYKGQLEKWYYEHKSLGLDIAILILTGLKIIAPSSKFEFVLFPSLPKNELLKA